MNNYQTKPLPSYNMRFLRYVRQSVQTAIPEDVSAVKSRSVYYSNLIFLKSSVFLWFLRVLLFSFTRILISALFNRNDSRHNKNNAPTRTEPHYQPRVEQGCTYPECQVAMATKFCMVAPNV